MYSIVYFPTKLPEKVTAFRNIYDQKSELIAPHVTLVFPFEHDNTEKIISHIDQVTEKISPFEFTISDHKKSFDDYLFLTMSNGNENITQLHQQLYSGELQQFYKTDIKYEPHLTVGYFRDNSDKFMDNFYKRALNEIQAIPLNILLRFDSVSLVEIISPKLPRKVVYTAFLK